MTNHVKVYQVEMRIIDCNQDISQYPDPEAELKAVIENTRYPNHCIHPDVMSIEARDAGAWNDDHPLNQSATADAEYRKLFPPQKLEALGYALQLVQGRRILNRPAAYLAAIDELEIFLRAAIERVEHGEEMHSTAVVSDS